MTPARRRLASAALVPAVTAAAGTWAVAALKSRQVHVAAVPSRSTLVGTWEVEEEGGRLHLDADGRFRATDVPAGMVTVGAWTDGTTSATGTWSLSPNGGRVALAPDDARGTEPDGTFGAEPDGLGLGVVETRGATHLCVESQSPGVLCDLLLRRTPG
ncbi:hypothetical protein [Streptomyces spiralis]|uniref:hypothetical protein n=1 Tax=Streptomyces spiralis TaxID=66376 RepID=UPI0036CEC46A